MSLYKTALIHQLAGFKEYDDSPELIVEIKKELNKAKN